MSAGDCGGHAFPTPEDRSDGHGVIHAAGMTLRDYFAAHIPTDPDAPIGQRAAELLLGRPCPKASESKEADPREVLLFWTEAEAAFRYFRADAMLRARTTTPLNTKDQLP